MSANEAVTAQGILALLRRWHARLLAGEVGLTRVVTRASVMRARVPAFEGFGGGELALLPLAALRALSAQLESFALPSVVEQLADLGVAAIAIVGLREGQALPPGEAQELDDALRLADQLALPLIALPASSAATLSEIERAISAHILARREWRPAQSELTAVEAATLRASLRSEALDALLTGAYVGEATMRAHAARLGYDLTLPHLALWVDLAPSGDMRALLTHGPRRASQPSRAPLHGPADAQRLATRLSEELGAALGAWAYARDTYVVALTPLQRGAAEQAPLSGETADARDTDDGPQRLFDATAALLARTRALLARALGDGSNPADPLWAAGVSEPATSPAQLHRGANEARDSARLGYAALGPRRIARPSDLGVYRLLLALRDGGELALFVERALAPLLADGRAGANDTLLDTLDAFFACNGNLSEAARRLHMHRNTLIYRLNRARTLLGHDLDDPEMRLTLQLALKGRRVLDL